jgi:hypothetical protein
VHGAAGYRYFARAKTGMTRAVFRAQVTVIPDHFGIKEKRDPGSEAGMTIFLLIFYAFHGQRRAGISRDVQGTAGYRYFVGAKTGMTWAVSHTQVTVIPVSEQSGEYRNLAFTLFTGNGEPDSLGMRRAQRDKVFCWRNNRNDMGCFSHVDR